MQTRMSLLVRLRIEVDTTKKAKYKIYKYIIFGKIVKVLYKLIKIAGKFCKMIGLNR